MIQAAERVGTFPLTQGHTQFLGTAAPIHRQGRARAGTAATEHFAGVWIGGQPLPINGIAVVLGQQLAPFPVELDQEVALWIQGNETLGESVVELTALAGIQSLAGIQRLAGIEGLGHGVDRRQR